MSREIKFRGKRIDNGIGEFVQGTLLKGITTEGKQLAYIIPCGTRYEVINSRLHRNTRLFEVDPETVGQYTEEHGERKEEIFEGDIVRWNSLLIEFEGDIFRLNRAVGEITFFDGCWFIQGDKYNGLLSNCLSIEVVGNVYENPELMGVPNGRD